MTCLSRSGKLQTCRRPALLDDTSGRCSVQSGIWSSQLMGRIESRVSGINMRCSIKFQMNETVPIT
jgi:hypothetical protein